MAIGLVSMLPAYFFMWFEYGFDQKWALAAVAEALALQIGLFIIGFVRSSDLSAERYELELSTANEALAKEVALFEQKLALNRRAWSRIIHGDVQAALSAAVTRLRRSSEPEPFEYELIKQDLARARAALRDSTPTQPPFSDLMASLTGAWGNVCAIKLGVSARAQRALDASADARSCVNEICKEAISNAVRHGDAKNAVITIDRIQDDLLTLEVSNDGGPQPESVKPGMGSQMIDELTLEWSLTSDAKQTLLKAVIPLQKS
jgi:light-regulated signal transduction histidine kinase (bacteriophytochrome)